MEEVLKNRHLKIFCPKHQATFEIAENPKIVCENFEHSLSNNFPRGEFWEYCCDCQTFFPSGLEVGEKAKGACQSCERPTVSRFVCGECKVVSFDSGEDTKGKVFQLNAETFAISPACPGCLKNFSGVKSNLHKCAEIDAVTATTRETCPFCKKETAKQKAAPAPNAFVHCPKCNTENEPDSFFCNVCGAEMRSNPNLSKRGTSTAKTQLLGSICPNCGASNQTDNVFCASCGQALKAEIPKPKKTDLPPTLPSVPQSSIPTQAFNQGVTPAIKPPVAVKPGGGSKGCIITIVVMVGALFLFGIIIIGIKSRINSSDSYSTPSPSRSSTPSYTPTPYPTNSSTSSSSSTTTTYTGKSGRVDMTMTLTRDGSRLTGTAVTAAHTDYLYGTIDSDGAFTLDGKEEDVQITGYYRGRINTDGSVSGTWTPKNGGRSASFSLSED